MINPLCVYTKIQKYAMHLYKYIKSANICVLHTNILSRYILCVVRIRIGRYRLSEYLWVWNSYCLMLSVPILYSRIYILSIYIYSKYLGLFSVSLSSRGFLSIFWRDRHLVILRPKKVIYIFKEIVLFYLFFRAWGLFGNVFFCLDY